MPDDADALAARICAQHGVDARYPCIQQDLVEKGFQYMNLMQ